MFNKVEGFYTIDYNDGDQEEWTTDELHEGMHLYHNYSEHTIIKSSIGLKQQQQRQQRQQRQQ